MLLEADAAETIYYKRELDDKDIYLIRFSSTSKS